MRDALIVAGRQLFETLDFAEVSLRLIAKHAGYSPGVVYKYFPDRDTLFRAIRDAELGPYTAELEAIFSSETDPELRILKMTRAATAFATKTARDLGIHFIYVTNALEKPEERTTDHTAGVDNSAFTQRIYDLHVLAAEAYLGRLDHPPVTPGEAALSLIAAVASMAVLPGSIALGPLQNRAEMTDGMIQAMLFYWREKGSR